ncbi:DUF354 domain-containing protein [Polaribacter porphyrae]|uniref:DUF354 domain-containing protein n=1 Tax=Polaribacter porphyrae TaxID=1137780 RepID=A0A2S7WJL2_9FLAO|nr:DUF354 domain-containing protein [Polaribacter porphyrae]PQJ77773.1 hypothetical protein BTO18_00590 [Polaribacter porphyrae]
MNILFFFVHPSKFHVFKKTINHLKSNGHNVDILITSKDVLEELVKNEGWNYTNIFPEGRKFKNVSPYISAGVNFFRTIHRLLKYCRNKKYDLFITDDLLVYVGKIKKIPTIAFTDDDLAIVKQFSIILKFANYILAPSITNLGKFNEKKIAFDGYKELAYLHPNQFTPDLELVKKIIPEKNFFILRLVSLTAYHDVGKSGITKEKAKQLISLLEKYGQVYISAERELSPELEKYKLKIEPHQLKDVLSQAKAYIGDSQTMSSEAAILGVPSFRFNDFVGKIGVMDEKDDVYKLSKSYKTSEFSFLLKDLENSLNGDVFSLKIKENQKRMLSEKVDLTSFMIWLLENFPDSIRTLKKNPLYQEKFINFMG